MSQRILWFLWVYLLKGTIWTTEHSRSKKKFELLWSSCLCRSILKSPHRNTFLPFLTFRIFSSSSLKLFILVFGVLYIQLTWICLSLPMFNSTVIHCNKSSTLRDLSWIILNWDEFFMYIYIYIYIYKDGTPAAPPMWRLEGGGGKGLVSLVNQLTLERCHSFLFYGSCRKRIPSSR